MTRGGERGGGDPEHFLFEEPFAEGGGDGFVELAHGGFGGWMVCDVVWLLVVMLSSGGEVGVKCGGE